MYVVSLARCSRNTKPVRLSQLTLFESVSQLRPIGNSQLGKDPVQMPTNSSVGEKQPLADLAVRKPFRRKLGDL
jgi:hypothetical protein